MQEYNEIKWAEDYISNSDAPEYYKARLREANEHIGKLEDSVEFWKQQHKEACEDYVYWKERYEAMWDGSEGV